MGFGAQAQSAAMKKQVLIAGGGIAGLAAALGAVRADWEVRLFERTEAFSEVGAGVQLGPNVVRRLQAWGLQAPLQAVAAFPERLVVRCALRGTELAALVLGSSVVRRYGAAYATVHRADLHQLLLEPLRAYADVHLNLGQSIVGCTQSADAVTVRMADQKVIEGDALLGADGLHSTVRQLVLADGAARFTGHLAYRAVIAQKDLPQYLRTQQVTVWLGPQMHIVQYPLRGGDLQNMVVLLEGPAPEDLESWNYLAHAHDLERVLGGACSVLQDAVRAMSAAGSAWRLWPLLGRPPVGSAREMAQGLVALVGDAAHPMLPYLAQGAGMAIEDAAELQSALSMHDLEVELRLRRYALNRWQRNAKVQARARRNGRVFHARGPVRWGRDMSLRLFGERLLDQPWLYQSGAVHS